MLQSFHVLSATGLRLLTVLLIALALFAPPRSAASNPLPGAPEEENAAAQSCDPNATIVYQSDPSSDAVEPTEAPCPARAADLIEADRAYLFETATPGGTMVRQGPALAIARLNPEFVRRLADAIRDARAAGLTSAGIFSAYRPPAFGVGGFTDKFESLHTYGLAVDMTGIGGPSSADAKTWYDIAARHGVVCPYGFDSRTEWNHCQPTRIKFIQASNPLRETVTAAGPVDLESMFDAGTALIQRAIAGDDAEHEDREPRHHEPVVVAETGHKHFERLVRLASVESRGWCGHSHRAGKAACGAPSHNDAGAKRQIAHLGHAAHGRESRRT